MTHTKALKLALEALELHLTHHEHGCVYLDPAITAIKEALAQPAQEPVAWQWLGSAHFRKKIPKNSDITAWNPLYTTPSQREWVGLTDDELLHIGVATGLERAAVQMIEAKLKEKNND